MKEFTGIPTQLAMTVTVLSAPSIATCNNSSYNAVRMNTSSYNQRNNKPVTKASTGCWHELCYCRELNQCIGTGCIGCISDMCCN